MYEINVSLNGFHLFATHERSLTNEDLFEKALTVFKEKFPKSEGYEITAMKIQKRNVVLNIDNY